MYTPNCLLSRFASFIEEKSWHVTDDELLEYDSGPEATPTVDPEDEEEAELSGDISVDRETDMDTSNGGNSSGQ